MTFQPLVSVVTPVFNTEKYLSECIESVLAQSYENWEYVIVNNCSTDRSLDIAQSYAENDPRIRIHNNKDHLSLLQNSNHALRQISPESKYCKVIHADDWIFKDCIKKMVEIASGNARDFKNVKFKLANAIDLPFESNSVDFIVSTGSFHHWKHPFKVFNECYSILKPDNEAWIYDGCSNPPKKEILKLKRQYGIFKYLVVSQIQNAHGFPCEIYKTKIKKLLGHTKFKNNFQMILTDGWMKIILKK